MKLEKTLTLLISLILFTSSFAQNKGKKSDEDNTAQTEETSDEENRIATPTLGIGMGVLTYYGDISRNYKTNNPITSRVALNLTVTQPITSYLSADLFYFRGKISANERSLLNNRNFESVLNGGGFQVYYNFDHILSPDRVVEPFVGVGFEFISFDSKTDLIDRNGNNYHYWSDGTIRNMDEESPNSSELSVRLERDYEYETDLRKYNESELGLYNNYTWGIPVSAGFNMIMTPEWNFRLGVTYHFTGSDYIDGVTPTSYGNKSGDSRNDHLLYVGFNVGYNIRRPKKVELPEEETPFLFVANTDEDGDGVLDFEDECAGTPDGVQVDEKGCPLDGDADDVGNYKDDELNSAPGAYVDTVGVTYTDERLLEMYLTYMDTTGKYSPIETESYTIDVVGARTKRKRNASQTLYGVQVGAYDDAIPSEMVTNMLNYKDVQTYLLDDQIALVVGKFPNMAAATEKQEELGNDGINSIRIVAIDPDGKIKSVDNRSKTVEPKAIKEPSVSEEGIAHYDESSMDDNQGVVYRVQLGAFKKKANEKAFRHFSNVMAVSSADGFTRYYTEPSSSYSDAARVKLDAIQNGFPNAYVVAVKGGTRVSIGAKENGSSGIKNLPEDVTLSDQQKEKLKFKVQLGSYKKQVPTDVLEKYMELGDIQVVVGQDGITRYVTGSFTDFKEANDHKNQLRSEGFEGCFVVGEYEGELLPAQKAIKLKR